MKVENASKKRVCEYKLNSVRLQQAVGQTHELNFATFETLSQPSTMGLVELYKRKLNDCKSRLILAQCHKIKLLRRDLQAYKGHLQSTSTLQTLVCHEDKILNTNTRMVLSH